MSTKEMLSKFIDATIRNDDEEAKDLFSSIATYKLNSIINPSHKIMESLITILKEDIDLGDGIAYKGTSIYVNGRRVGNVEFIEKDETGTENTMSFIGTDGKTFTVPDNDISELAEYIRQNFVVGK